MTLLSQSNAAVLPGIKALGTNPVHSMFESKLINGGGKSCKTCNAWKWGGKRKRQRTQKKSMKKRVSRKTNRRTNKRRNAK